MVDWLALVTLVELNWIGVLTAAELSWVLPYLCDHGKELSWWNFCPVECRKHEQGPG